MEKRIKFDRRFYDETGEIIEPLEVTMILPEEISEYLKRFRANFDEKYLDSVINELKLHFLHERFYKEPSFESEQTNALELVAYDIRRDSRNPFLTKEEDVFVTLEPKYKPKWVDTDPRYSGKIGFLNSLSTNEFCGFDPITTFVMNAYRHLG